MKPPQCHEREPSLPKIGSDALFQEQTDAAKQQQVQSVNKRVFTFSLKELFQTFFFFDFFRGSRRVAVSCDVIRDGTRTGDDPAWQIDVSIVLKS
jgi:hypothetical protein